MVTQPQRIEWQSGDYTYVARIGSFNDMDAIGVWVFRYSSEEDRASFDGESWVPAPLGNAALPAAIIDGLAMHESSKGTFIMEASMVFASLLERGGFPVLD